MCIRDSVCSNHKLNVRVVRKNAAIHKLNIHGFGINRHDGRIRFVLSHHNIGAVSYTHLDVYKRQGASYPKVRLK